MNWKITPKYAAAVFIAQFMLGFFEGSLFLAVAAGWVFALILYPWFGSPNAIDVIIEYILLVCALVTGTSFGIMWQQKKSKEKA